MDLKEQQILGDRADRHWYYRAKSAAMLRMLRGTAIDSVLDVGAGSGFFSRHLLDHTDAASAICVDPNYPAEISELHNGKPIAFVRHLDRFAGHVVLMMDVLEHVPDDTALLAEYAALAPPGTRFLITVPALAWMWSAHDEFLEHYRRYTVGEVDRLVARAGLKRLRSCYYFGFALPMAAAFRLGRKLIAGRGRKPGSDMKLHSAPVNAALWQICAAELPLFSANRLAGLSVFALAEKPGRDH
jgi:SAM-dependent methyltransferase